MTAEIAHIYRRGDHYDRLFSKEAHPFWQEVAQSYAAGPPPGAILELGCGTGRIAIPLAQAGFPVTGLDATPAMLAEARRKAEQAGVEVSWREGDMRDFDLGETFSLILLPNNTLCHLLTRADFEACMACVLRHLAPNGRFVVEAFVPDPTLLIRKPEERHVFSAYDDPDGRGKVVVYDRVAYNPATQIRHIRTYYKFPDRAQEEEGRLTLRMYFPQELDALFHYNGFAIEHKYGSLDRAPFDARARTQVFVLARR
jgi:SAM-dependent methyltransferase